MCSVRDVRISSRTMTKPIAAILLITGAAVAQQTTINSSHPTRRGLARSYSRKWQAIGMW